jgi:hypothetical protein
MSMSHPQATPEPRQTSGIFRPENPGNQQILDGVVSSYAFAAASASYRTTLKDRRSLNLVFDKYLLFRRVDPAPRRRCLNFRKRPFENYAPSPCLYCPFFGCSHTSLSIPLHRWTNRMEYMKIDHTLKPLWEKKDCCVVRFWVK